MNGENFKNFDEKLDQLFSQFMATVVPWGGAGSDVTFSFVCEAFNELVRRWKLYYSLHGMFSEVLQVHEHPKTI